MLVAMNVHGPSFLEPSELSLEELFHSIPEPRLCHTEGGLMGKKETV